MENREASSLDFGMKLKKMDISLTREKIMENFRKHTYKVCRIPCALFLKESKVHYIGHNVGMQDPLETLEGDFAIKKVENSKLGVKLYNTSDLYVGMINKEFVDTRGDFDKFSYECWYPPHLATFNEENIDKLDSISFQDAMEIFRCSIFCNKEYYSTKDEIEKDLNRKLETCHLKNEDYFNDFKDELLFKLLLNVFGDIQDKEEEQKLTVIFRDFHLLKNGSAYKIGTAERKDHFIVFYYAFDD